MYDYLKGLNIAQRQAVEHIEGPSLVIAGAGSGKTRVLTYRIAHLINKGVKPYAILSLTFTNKAAKEMKARIAGIVGSETAKWLWMGTFHSIFARLLRAESQFTGYPPTFTIYDTSDTKNLIKSIVKELHLDEKVYKPSDVYGRISSAKNNLISPEAYESNAEMLADDRASRRPEIARIYKIYAARCRKADAMDFDDLLLRTNILFRDHPQVLEKYRNKFRYILVDEYQDTNFAQFLIIKRLAEVHQNICVVGDDAQSIYAFRGAQIENILNFKNQFAGCQVFKLEQNYRSTQTIVNAANSLISKNKRQLQKRVFSENEAGQQINVILAVSDQEEGFRVANSIMEACLREHYDFSDFAILYRTNAQSRIMEEALRRMNIPYRIYGGLSFYDRKEVKDLLAYYRLTVNHNDDEALKRIINYPKRQIGEATVEKLELTANEHQVSIWNVIADNRMLIQCALPAATAARIAGFASLISGYSAALDTSEAYELAYKIASETGILKELHSDRSPEGVSRYENVQELLNAIKSFDENQKQEQTKPSLDKYLEEVALLTGDEADNKDSNNKVSLMTVHASKGLEFKNVYLTGLEENLFPSQFANQSSRELEEERRLFYVAMTRAEKNLTLSMARTRYKWGNLTDSSPSRFLSDIDPAFISPLPMSGNSKPRIEIKPSRPEHPHDQGSEASGTPQRLRPVEQVMQTSPQGAGGPLPATHKVKIGNTIVHERFGKGQVVEIEGNLPNTKITIRFDAAGIKQLLLKYAKFQILSE